MERVPVRGRIVLEDMVQLAEAVDERDDWTGLSDAKARRKRQNRLNVRAHRRRKALEEQTSRIQSQNRPAAIITTTSLLPPSHHPVPWNPSLNQQPITQHTIHLTTQATSSKSQPLIPYLTPQTLTTKPLEPTIIFPLPADHLLTLIQYNVVRAILTNMSILSLLSIMPLECTNALSIPPFPAPAPAPATVPTSQSSSPLPLIGIPPSLYPTPLQLSTPNYPLWIWLLPCPRLRDNLILAHLNTIHLNTQNLSPNPNTQNPNPNTNSSTPNSNPKSRILDEDELCSDLIGGLFEGFNDIEETGILVWKDPWSVEGWEVTQGFCRKWGWLLEGCVELVGGSNRWRRARGEEELDFVV